MHISLSPQIKAIDHLPAYVPERGGGIWSEWWEPIAWEMDYVECPGVTVEMVEPTGTTHQFAWPEKSWVVFSPGIKYKAIFDKPVQAHEEVWIQFTTGERLGAMERKSHAVVADPEGILLRLAKSLAQCHDQGSAGYDLTITGHLMTLLGELQRAANMGSGGISQDPWIVSSELRAKENGLLGKVDRAVLANLAHPPPLATLAKLLEISISSLAHRFKAETGWTVVERIRWLRIREAQQMMSQNKMSVKEVGSKLGFSSAAYFSKVFAEVSGLSPREFLRSRKTEL